MVSGQLFSITMEGKLYFDGGSIGEQYCDYPLMQYTGLKDKNGVEVFLGDVVTVYCGVTDESNLIGEVVFEEYCYCICIKFDDKSYPCRMRIDSYPLEVIGNIYENPELLDKPTVKGG
jgi:uncharacterized phage protein (TIGR01671 family)